jgi:1,4-dihydroxy-2-naphthoate octaprenyltransferase
MIRALAGVARAQFLLLSVTLVAVGAAASAWEGDFSWLRTVVALVGLAGLHIAVNAFNEVSDFRTGIDLATVRTPFSGGSGILPSGALTPRAGLLLGSGGALIGLAAGLWFLSLVGWKLLPILFLGAVSTLGYTQLLARAYLGELFAGLGLGALPVVGAAMVQDGRLGPAALAAALPAFCMTLNLLLLNEFPDEAADRAGGRKNLIVLLGRRGAAFVYAVMAVIVPATVVAAVVGGSLPAWALLGALPSLLVVRPVAWALRRPESEVPVPALAANVAWNLATNASLALGLAIATVSA